MYALRHSDVRELAPPPSGILDRPLVACALIADAARAVATERSTLGESHGAAPALSELLRIAERWRMDVAHGLGHEEPARVIPILSREAVAATGIWCRENARLVYTLHSDGRWSWPAIRWLMDAIAVANDIVVAASALMDP